ncbi:4'-phosphopantetheinyl transferase family protein [Streptomyces sp. NBC_01465]|uniref:4'-phosphopantetheinyl transferase family protein n=1 Tax=Streptomyces sp. NBC_01465 TaxID=2903878 RepID=UPI002E356428|nr:4'-phosphopantetheinyl transferase superfamily protein [Streptomyces sp. NBC_01465]
MTAPQPGAPPVHVAGPDTLWDEVCERAEDTGRVVVHTTWGEWLGAALLDPDLRTLLGQDWPRYRKAPDPAGRFVFAASRLLMKHTAAAVLGADPADLDIAYQPGGRPTLRGFGEELHLSLAHTEELIVAAVSRSGPVGVDTESGTREISYDLLRSHVCTPAEAEVLDVLPDGERTARFLRLWTLKEAYTKALGQGMRRRFTAVGFHWDANGRPVLAEDSARARSWSFATHLVQDRFLVSEAHHRVEVEPRSPSVPQKPVDDGVPLARTLLFPGPGRPGGR